MKEVRMGGRKVDRVGPGYGGGGVVPPLLEPCRTVEEFDLWLQAHLGYRAPHVAVCPEHVSPLEAFWAIASDQVGDAFLLANRSGTKTLGISALITYFCLTRPNYEVVVMAAALNQADKIVTNIRQKFLPRLAQYHPTIFRHNTMTVSASRIKFPTGSVLEVRSATLTGTNAPHPHMVVFDEVECFEEWSIIEEALSMAQDDHVKGYPAHNIFSSSRKFRFGIAQKLLNEANARGITVFAWCVFETMARVPECPNCSDCGNVVRGDGKSFKEICRGKGAWSGGYLQKNHVLDEFRRLSPATFDAQWLGLRPPPVGLVFPELNVQAIQANAYVWQPQYITYIGVDFGFQDPTVVLCAQLVGNEIIVFKEFVWRQRALSQILQELQGIQRQFQAAAWFCDPSRPDLIVTLQEAGIPAMPAPRLPKQQRIDIIRNALCTIPPSIRIDVPNCPLLIEQLQAYHYEIDKRTGEPSDKIKDGNDDTIDALSYLVAGWGQGTLAFFNPYTRTAPEASSQTPTPNLGDLIGYTLQQEIKKRTTPVNPLFKIPL